MRPFIYSIIFLFTINTIFSQTEELVLRKGFDIDQNTILNLDVDNATIQFVESTEDKIHIAYSVLFEKNSEEVVFKVFKDLYANATKSNNVVNLEVKNSMYLGELHALDVNIETYTKHIGEYIKNIKKNEFLYKSKNALLKEIKNSSGLGWHDYFNRLKRDNPNKNFGKSNKRFKQNFIIKAPKYVMLQIKALRSKINFNYDLLKPIELNSFNTYLKFKGLTNPKNKFSLHSGIFQSEKVVGGTFFFKDVIKVRIGSISEAKLKTETSKIQIGEVNRNVEFKDFNSKLHFYNFDTNFVKLDFVGDYSELNFYNIKDENYAMHVFGFNTALNLNNVKTTFPLKKDEKLTKILEKKAKNNSQNRVDIELKNGILNIR